MRIFCVIERQTVKEALAASDHVFTGLENGMINVIDGVGGNYTRSDEDGSYDMDQPASEVKYFRFSEDSDSIPGTGLQSLMKAMADYSTKEADVKNAAKEAYEMAYKQFSGIEDESAQVLADQLNKAVSDYENNLTAGSAAVTFSDGISTYAGISIEVWNAYGKTWTDEGEGIVELPAGTYHFCISQDGLAVEGTVEVAAEPVTVTAPLPQELWLKRDAFWISGSYGAESSEENRFTDDEYTVGEGTERQVTAAYIRIHIS